MMLWQCAIKHVTVMSILLTACPLDLTVGTDAIVLTIAGTLTTAIWEELYFRKVGCSLFEEEGKKNRNYPYFKAQFIFHSFMGAFFFLYFFLFSVFSVLLQ